MSFDKLEEAISLINNGQPDAARPLLIDFLRTKPQDEVAWRYLTRILPTTGQKIEALEHCLRLNAHSQWAQNALAELVEQRTRERQSRQKIEPPKPEAPKQELIPDGIFQPGKKPSSPGIDWAIRDRQGASGDRSTNRSTRPSSLPGGMIGRRGLSRFRHLKKGLIGAGLLSVGVIAVFYLLGRINGSGLGAETSALETQAVSAAPLEPALQVTPTPPPRPTATAQAVPTAEPVRGPFTLPEVQPVSDHPVITTRNANKAVLLSQWFVAKAVSVAFSPDGTLLAAGGWDGTVWIWETRTLLQSPWGRGQDLYHFNQPFGVNSVAFSPDGNTLAFGISAIKEPLRLLDISGLTTGGEPSMRSFEGHTDGVKSVAFSPDGNVLASSSFDDTVRFWDLASGRELAMIDGLYIEKIAFSPDQQAVATAFFDHGYTTIVWDFPRLIDKGMYSQEMATILDGGPGAAFSLDGEKFVTAEERISIWASPGLESDASPRHLQTLPGHTELVQCLALIPDGSVLASGARDRKIKLWDTASGRELITLVGHENRLHSLAFSPDGSLLASAADDGTVRLWGIPNN